jgi:hypothetical protein
MPVGLPGRDVGAEGPRDPGLESVTVPLDRGLELSTVLEGDLPGD